MDRFLAWLAELHPLTIHVVIGVSTFLENVFPPVPSDVAAALGGFLSQQGAVSPTVVWLVAWLSNLAGAVVVYLVAQRYGRGFVGSRLGQQLLPPDAIIGMERAYLRFGIAGIFASRFLPGFRSFVAPFIGLVNLPPLRALATIGVASGLWYAGIVWAGARLGEEWDTISHFISQVNRTLGLIALLTVGLIGWWVWRRVRERGPRRAQLARALRRALGDEPTEGTPSASEDPAATGAAALLHELTHSDTGLTLEERTEVADFLRERWGLGIDLRHSLSASNLPEDTRELATMLASTYDRARRLALLERLYRIALAHGALTRHEERIMRRAADLLGLQPEDLAEARERAQG